MHGSPRPEAPPAGASLESSTLELYEAGRYLDAYQRVEQHGGLDALTGTAGRALAGRLASVLGADRYGSAIHLRAWRREPDPNELGFFVGMAVARLWGPVRALDLLGGALRQSPTPKGTSDIQSARAYQFCALRDFAQGEAALAAAYEAAPERPWLPVTEGYLLRSQDRIVDATAAFRRALELRPFYRPAVQSLADALVQQNEVDEARELLIEASERLQCGMVLMQLAQLERELLQYESAQRRMHEALPRLPLRERDRNARGAYAGFAATLAYDVGDIDEAIRLGEESDTTFHKSVVKNLRENRDTGRRVVLDVGFTLQQDMTCVPATLSTLTQFWDKPVDHLDIAEAICYDGTPAHAERAWLEERGFFCREFTLTWEAATALIDAGLPFTQTLTGYGAGHMQAVIGYDSRRGVLIYRDPNVRHSGEVLAKELLEQLRSTGPRGMVFVPAEERGRVEALELPDHEFWAYGHRVSFALAHHRRDEAAGALESMQDEAPDHRLTLHAQARIASYDGDLRLLHQLTDRLIEEFPKDQNQLAVKLRLLRQMGSREDRLATLDELCGRSEVELVYRHQLIEELLSDPAASSRVDFLLRRCMRANPVDAQTLSLQARRAWIMNDREGAFLWSRYAACLESRSEDRSATYFAAACALGRSEEALATLRDRFDRFGQSDAGPAMSLIEALDHTLKQEEAIQVLQAALKATPDDGDLRLFACSYLLSIGRRKEAVKQLEKAKGRTYGSAWLSAAARVARQENRLDEAYEHLEESLKQAPLSIGEHRQAVEVLADSRGVEPAIEHLRRYIERFPDSLELRALLVEFSNEAGPERAEAAAREHLQRHPEDAWCWRELGFRLVDLRRWEEAREAAGQADRFDPEAMHNRLLHGLIDLGEGRPAEARERFLAAVRHSVDYAAAFSELMLLCETRDERREALAEILAQFKTQVIRGETLGLFRAYAARAYEPEETLEILEQARLARPDLLATWSEVVKQLLVLGRTTDALGEARGAAERFPLAPSVWIDLAEVYREMDEPEQELKQLRRALAINSRSGETLRLLAECYNRAGDARRERAMLERACQSEPRNVTHQGALAEFHWIQGNREEAISTIRQAIEKEPLYEWGWGRLTEWSFVIGQPETLVAMARDITESRPRSVATWLQRAELLARFPERAEECSDAIRRALELDPRSVDAHEQHAIFLASQGLFDEAITACYPPELGDTPPMRLRARAAVVESQRGDLDAAISRMRKVVDADPDYAWAWSQLAGWLQHQGLPDQALDAAKRLLVLAPKAPASWGYVAECLAAQDQLDESKKHLKKSIELDPAYLYGGVALLSLQVDAKEYEEGLQTLVIIAPHLSDYEHASRAARLHALLKNEEESLLSLRRAARADADTDELLLEAVDAILQAGWVKSLGTVLLTEIKKGRATPQAVSVCVEIFAREARITDIEKLCGNLDPAGPHWAEAAAAYLDVLAEAEANDRLDAFVQPRREKLRRHGRTWGLVGSALQRGDRFQETIDWMSDWSERSDAEPHQLASLALVLLKVGRTAEAKAVVDHGQTLPLAPATDFLRVMGALAELFEEDPTAAVMRLEHVTPGNLSPYYASLHYLVRGACLGAVALERGESWGTAQGIWGAAFEKHHFESDDPLYAASLAYCRMLLASRRRAPLLGWFARRKAERLLARVAG